MIQAFHAVPLQSASVKTTLLAAGISKAMVTTASGLIVAIPALIAYSYFRGTGQEVTNVIEIYSTDIIKAIQNQVEIIPSLIREYDPGSFLCMAKFDFSEYQKQTPGDSAGTVGGHCFLGLDVFYDHRCF